MTTLQNLDWVVLFKTHWYFLKTKIFMSGFCVIWNWRTMVLKCSHMLYLCICVFCICIFVIACLTHRNIIFDILEQSAFQKYATCWVFLALRHILYLCICVFCICIFVIARLTHGNKSDDHIIWNYDDLSFTLCDFGTLNTIFLFNMLLQWLTCLALTTVLWLWPNNELLSQSYNISVTTK